MTQFTCKGVKQINNRISLNMTFTFTIHISRRFSSAREFQMGNFQKYWSQNVQVGQDFIVLDFFHWRKILKVDGRDPQNWEKNAPAGRFTCMRAPRLMFAQQYLRNGFQLQINSIDVDVEHSSPSPVLWGSLLLLLVYIKTSFTEDYLMFVLLNHYYYVYCFVYYCLSFVLFLLTIVMSTFLRLMASDCPFGIFKLFLLKRRHLLSNLHKFNRLAIFD
jgi:hypothetical protein